MTTPDKPPINDVLDENTTQNTTLNTSQNTNLTSSKNTRQNLRGRAEAIVEKKPDLLPGHHLTLEAANELAHELQVHQIELQMQNEELRESHAALDIMRARYFDLYDLAPIGYLTLNQHNTIQQANLTVANMLGIARSTLIKLPFTKLIFKADQDVFYLNHKHLIESTNPQSFDLRIIQNSETPLWVNCVITLAHDYDGEPEIRVVVSDVTVRKQSQQALAESEAHYHTLFNSIDEGFCVIEVIFDHANKPIDYRFLEVNPSFIKQSGLKEALGKRMSEFAPDLDEEWFEIYGKVVTTGQSVRFIKEAKELEDRWFDVYAFRLGGAEDKKVAILFTDTSQRKHEELKLIAARQIADKANLAKSEFLSNMSHELRTPLNAILGFAQLLQASNPPPTEKSARNIDQIIKAGWYLLELINEILDLAAIDAGKIVLAMETLSLADVLSDSIAMLENEAQKRDISLIYKPCDVPYFIQADRIRVKQVFVNLLSNAIKYNKPNGSVKVKCALKSHQRIRVCIEDTGEGISPGNIAQLFQPFNRLGKESSPEQGTGIGLVVSKRIVELMDGGIGVESTVGEGCKFWVELNLTDAP